MQITNKKHRDFNRIYFRHLFNSEHNPYRSKRKRRWWADKVFLSALNGASWENFLEGFPNMASIVVGEMKQAKALGVVIEEDDIQRYKLKVVEYE